MRELSRITLLNLILFACWIALPAAAQNVTIRPNNGSMIAATKSGGNADTFYGWGAFATWRHNQLDLIMTTADSDEGKLTENGQLENPANNIYGNTATNEMQLGRGNSIDCWMTIALPKGYRFTGYTIVFSRNIRYFGTGGESATNGTATFGETSGDGNFTFKEGYYKQSAYNANAAKQTITRTSMTDSDMGNVLYFKLTNTNGRAFITLHSIELRYTTTASETPVEASSVFNRSAVDIPFSTSKVDYGSITNRNYNNTTRLSYNSGNVSDLEAEMVLYEAESVTEGMGIDKTVGKVVDYREGTISNEGDYFKLGRSTGDEQVYFLETPTYITNSAGLNNPIGYRIIGAEFEYTYGQARAAETRQVEERVKKEYPAFYISVVANNTTYYMTGTTGVTTSQSEAAMWFRDDDGYIRLADSPTSYLKTMTVGGTNNRLGVVYITDSPAKYNISNNGQITGSQNNNLYLTLQMDRSDTTPNFFMMSTSNGQTGNGNGRRYYHRVSRTVQGSTTLYKTETKTVTVPAFTPSDYTLVVYDKDGDPLEEIAVNSTNPDGTYILPTLNNDAVKFGVKGVGLVKAMLILQALDPYINSMDVVCHDVDHQMSLSQSFTADDFSVSGGTFVFYVPEEYQDELLSFSFENLYSQYGDYTYHDGSGVGNSRYCFVSSDYFTPVNGNGNEGQYDSAYDQDHTYTDKVVSTKAGNQPFTFSNAATLGTSGGVLEEYPFSVKIYQSPASQGGSGGEFIDVKLQASASVHSGTYYLFTADETRYNIAPTSATQHRYYAFYTVNLDLEAKTYTPVLTWKKVYDKTCFDADGNGTDTEDSQWGLTLGTKDSDTGATVTGYITYHTLKNAIEKAVANGDNSTVPATTGQILYIDASNLYSLVNSSETTLEDVKAMIGPNGLVYLPENTTSTLTNVAYKTTSGLFHAGKDIVITDKKPFFAPYAIQVDAANYAKYERQVTVSQNGRVAYATLMLPFTIALSDGVHTNDDGSCSFSLNTMQSANCLDDGVDPDNDFYVDYETYAHFNPLTADRSEANVPYMVQVTDAAGVDNTLSFIVMQKGSSIAATPATADYTLPGETATGTVSGSTYTFANHASYSGKKLSTSEKIFYFAANHYFSTTNLKKNGRNFLYVYPFRGYYTYGGGTGTNEMTSFAILCGDPQEATSGIADASAQPDLAVTAGKGTLTLTSTVDQTVLVISAAGFTACRLFLLAGNSQTVALPAGVYVVNGVKLVVR